MKTELKKSSNEQVSLSHCFPMGFTTALLNEHLEGPGPILAGSSSYTHGKYIWVSTYICSNTTILLVILC